ncbi:glycosyltransferase family 2 protein [Mycobacterium sp. SMC-4]|uniref:glycosyltransferase family 2 protein n=1 Tax=Mycobacterium sp. SMC-4 TaxID=2857059 RepID=UPI003CFE97D7
MTRPTALDPVMPVRARPNWRHARWIGVLDLDDEAYAGGGGVEFIARQSQGYRHARVLVRHAQRPLAFVEAPIVDGRVNVSVRPERPDVPATEPEMPPISVVVCTRDRPDQLTDALKSVLLLDYPDFEVVVVDNAARTAATADVVTQLGDARVRRIAEPIPGLSVARNTGLRSARHDIVAFTDDDVVVDRGWLRGLAHGFDRDPQITCVSGLVPTGELRTAAQAYFDQRVSWAGSLEPRVYRMSDPPEDQPLFPFQVGRFGTGANFAVRRKRVLELGGFDHALGAGTPAQGGEDLDMFFRVLTQGDALATEPSAIVWHRHRSDSDALLSQARGYGRGLGAWLTKVALDPQHRRLAGRVIRRALVASVRFGMDYGSHVATPEPLRGEVPPAVGRTEVLAVLGGPRALWQGRRNGRAQRGTRP